MTETKPWSVRNLPVEIIERLKKQAEKNHRSLNGEIIAVLDKGTKGDKNV